MKRNIAFITTCLLLIGIAGALAFSLGKVEALEPNGTWKAVDSNYFIVFDGDGFYESTYNVWRPFSYTDGGILMSDAAGIPYFVELAENCGGKAVVYLNGETHVMRRATETEAANPLMYRWGSAATSNCLAAYTLMQDISTDYYLRLYEGNVFTSTIGTEETVGKYTVAADGNILLLTEEGTRVDSLHRWTEGAAFGELVASIQLTENWLSPVDLLGYYVSGIIKDMQLGTTYSFVSETTCIREQPDGTTTEFLYFVNNDGLITLTDAAGSGVMDYLYYDIQSGTPYRYVLDTDDWFAYIHGNAGTDIFSTSGGNGTGSKGDGGVVPLIPGEGEMRAPVGSSVQIFRGEGAGGTSSSNVAEEPAEGAEDGGAESEEAKMPVGSHDVFGNVIDTSEEGYGALVEDDGSQAVVTEGEVATEEEPVVVDADNPPEFVTIA